MNLEQERSAAHACLRIICHLRLNIISPLKIDRYNVYHNNFLLANQEKREVADETITDENPAATATKTAEPAGDKPATRTRRKRAVTRSSKSAATSASQGGDTETATRSAAKTVSATRPTTGKRNKYTPAQRASILASIEKATKDGKTTLKAALKDAALSEQTYYNWKNAAGKSKPTNSSSSASDDLATLVALEAENLRLRKELADKLRAENAELRKRLGKL